MTRKKVAIVLPNLDMSLDYQARFSIELGVLNNVAELVEVRPDDGLTESLKSADAIITSWGVEFNAKRIAQLRNCKVIGVGSVGVDMVDIPAATDAGMIVTNVPDVFIEEVADHAMMLLMATVRQAKTMNRLASSEKWSTGRPLLSEVPRFWGQTLGLIAFGNVARCVARRAKPFGINVIACDPYLSELVITGEGVEPVSFSQLLTRSDYVSMHAPHNEETHHMLDRTAFECMKESAVVVNTGRGPTIHEADLINALQQGTIAGAGLDVLEFEPPAADNPLLNMENVILSPHVASATTRMRPETRRRAALEVVQVLKGRWPMSCVNPTALPKTNLERWQPVSMERGPNR